MPAACHMGAGHRGGYLVVYVTCPGAMHRRQHTLSRQELPAQLPQLLGALVGLIPAAPLEPELLILPGLGLPSQLLPCLL